MNEKVSTISARFSRSQLETLERLQEELGLSRTDVIQLAIDHLGTTKVTSPSSRVEVPISAETLRRASRLHRQYGYKVSLEMLLSEAVEIGVREIRSNLKKDRDEDADLARSEMDARAIELQQDMMREP